MACATVTLPGWPGWGGPTGDFKVKSRGLANSWSEEGPRQLWNRELGDGYSGILVDGNRLYTLYLDGETEVVVALEATTGKTLWKHTYPAEIKKKPDNITRKYGLGPQATPLLTKGYVVAIGWNGDMYCLKKSTGEVVWFHSLSQEFNSPVVMSRGYSPSPLAYKGLILCLVGGQGHSFMAFDVEDGRVIWSKHNFKRSHSSPILINVDGQDQLVGMMDQEILGVNPSNGDLLWSHTHGLAGDLTISTPLGGQDGLVFISTAYTGGSRALQLTRSNGQTSVQELWFTRKMRVHHGNMIRLGNLVYGSSGDFGPAFLTAIHVSTGVVAWKERLFAKATLIYADGKFIVLDEDGMLALARPSVKGLTVLAKAQILEHNCWTVPSLVGTTLYVRSRKKILALDLK